MHKVDIGPCMWPYSGKVFGQHIFVLVAGSNQIFFVLQKIWKTAVHCSSYWELDYEQQQFYLASSSGNGVSFYLLKGCGLPLINQTKGRGSMFKLEGQADLKGCMHRGGGQGVCASSSLPSQKSGESGDISTSSALAV